MLRWQVGLIVVFCNLFALGHLLRVNQQRHHCKESFAVCVDGVDDVTCRKMCGERKCGGERVSICVQHCGCITVPQVKRVYETNELIPSGTITLALFVLGKYNSVFSTLSLALRPVLAGAACCCCCCSSNWFILYLLKGGGVGVATTAAAAALRLGSLLR